MKLRVIAATLCLSFMALLASTAAPAQSADEQSVWKLEQSYWEYVKANDLPHYRDLWHDSFVGWPYSSAKPVHKDHITDWITSETGQGRHLESFKLEHAAIQAGGNVVITHYWLTEHWTDKQGRGKPDTMRITHTWIRTPGGWQILGGMSAPVEKGASQ